MYFNNLFDVIIRRIKHENGRYLLNTIKKMQILVILPCYVLNISTTGHKDARA